jgi:hypothetical protein
MRARENALALRMLRFRFGEDVFERCRELPGGWLELHKHIVISHRVRQSMPHRHTSFIREKVSISLAEFAVLPNSARTDWDREMFEPLFEEVCAVFASYYTLEDEVRLVGQQARSLLTSIHTVEKLCDAWPEGFAFLPQEELAAPNFPVPAPRIMDINARIAALREVA